MERVKSLMFQERAREEETWWYTRWLCWWDALCEEQLIASSREYVDLPMSRTIVDGIFIKRDEEQEYKETYEAAKNAWWHFIHQLELMGWEPVYKQDGRVGSMRKMPKINAKKEVPIPMDAGFSLK